VSGVPDALAEALAGRYVIEHELGQGGMASVYQARAPGRAEPVAIKVMNPNLADALDSKRFDILLARGRALIADFGLARAIGAADYTKLTATGVIVGTLYYMSPEQLREESDLDQRTDVYSLGCMLYEMLAGELPYTGRTLTEVASRILRGSIPSVRRLRPEVPASVEAAIGRALAKARADRFTTMAELLAALPS
jgi:serine/threonine-protein kinase